MPISCGPEPFLSFPEQSLSLVMIPPNVRTFSHRSLLPNVFWRICVIIGSPRFCMSPTVCRIHPNTWEILLYFFWYCPKIRSKKWVEQAKPSPELSGPLPIFCKIGFVSPGTIRGYFGSDLASRDTYHYCCHNERPNRNVAYQRCTCWHDQGLGACLEDIGAEDHFYRHIARHHDEHQQRQCSCRKIHWVYRCSHLDHQRRCASHWGTFPVGLREQLGVGSREQGRSQ